MKLKIGKKNRGISMKQEPGSSKKINKIDKSLEKMAKTIIKKRSPISSMK